MTLADTDARGTAPTTDQPMVLRDDNDGVTTLTLNRPKAYNALSSGLMTALQDQLDRVAKDQSVHVVIIKGAGKGFCAGHDLKEVRTADKREVHEALFRQCSRLMMSITHLPKPVIAQVHGIATAAGCQLVASCDLAVASNDASFATPGVNIGLFCTTPMVAVSRAVARKPMMEMLLTGDMISAEHAQSIGLINRLAGPEDLEQKTNALARQIADKSPLTLAIGKEAFYHQLEMSLEDAYAYTSQVMVRNLEALDAKEGIDAFMEKRKPIWRGE